LDGTQSQTGHEGEKKSLPSHHFHFEEWVRISLLYLSEFIASEKKKSPIITAAVTAHHMPTLTSCKGTLCTGLEFSDNQHLLFCVCKLPTQKLPYLAQEIN
jgi:hypothetical protein